MGPVSTEATLRKALSIGADEAILISDEKLPGSDAPATAKVLATVIREGNFDLVICGTESTNARMSVIPAMLAAELGWAPLTFANYISVNPESKTIDIKRITNENVDHISTSFPAVISVVEKINEPRYPSFKEIMAAKKKTISTKNFADLGLDETSVGSWSQVKSSLSSPPRQAGVLIKDEGSVGKVLVDFLKEKGII
jgi:electron transfer flavoprotein beta subunit